MPFSSGTFSVVYNWTTESGAAPIEISKLDEQHTDFATGLSNCILRDGTGLPTATIDWNTQDLSGVKALTAQRLIVTGSTVPANGVYLSAANTLALASNTTLRGSVNSAGNWTLASPSSGVTLTVPGSSIFSMGTGVAGAFYAGIVGSTNNPRIQLTATEGSGNFDLDFTASASVGTASISRLGNAVISISNTRNVTVAAPGSGVALAVNGFAGQSTATFQDSAVPKLALFVSSSERMFMQYTEGTATGRIDSDSVLELASNNTARMSFSNAGNVTINAASSGTELTVTGEIVATSFSGALSATDLTSGTVPDARFPATLPALNGSALTALNATQLTSGTVPDARFPATLPALNGSALTNLNASNLASGTVPSARITAVDAAATISSNLIGFRDIPRQTSGWNRGQCSAISAGVTLNTSDMSAGYTFSLYNDSASSITITQGAGVTLRLHGTATTGNRTLSARGFATIWCNSGTEAIVLGDVS